jgi:hypothetical protein
MAPACPPTQPLQHDVAGRLELPMCRRRTIRGIFPCSDCSWAERADGPSARNRSGLAATMGLDRLHSIVSLFSVDLIQIPLK